MDESGGVERACAASCEHAQSHVRFQIITFRHDTIHGTFNQWDDTISGTTCGWTSPEAQSGLVLPPVNTHDNTDEIRTVC